MIQRAFNNSRLRTFQECKRWYAYAYILNIWPRTWQFALNFGIAVHEGLAHWYASQLMHMSPVHEGLLRSNATEKEGAEAGKVSRDSYMALQPPNLDAYDRRDAEETSDWAARLVEAYCKERASEFNPLQVESEFNVELGEVCWACGHRYEGSGSDCVSCGAPIWRLVGRADLLVYRGPHLWLVDHKTSKNVTSKSISNWARSFQLIGYSYGVAKATGLKVSGYFVNFLKRLKTVGTEKARGEPFISQGFPLHQEDVFRFVHNRVQICNEIRKHTDDFDDVSQRTDSFPMSDTCCFKCPYTDICWDSKYDRWWDVGELPGFQERPKDYVSLAEEERI